MLDKACFAASCSGEHFSRKRVNREIIIEHTTERKGIRENGPASNRNITYGFLRLEYKMHLWTAAVLLVNKVSPTRNIVLWSQEVLSFKQQWPHNPWQNRKVAFRVVFETPTSKKQELCRKFFEAFRINFSRFKPFFRIAFDRVTPFFWSEGWDHFGKCSAIISWMVGLGNRRRWQKRNQEFSSNVVNLKFLLWRDLFV